MSAAGIHYDHPSFDVFSETTAVNRNFMSGARLHYDHPSFDACSGVTAGNRKQAAAQNSCIKPKLWKQHFARQRPSGNSSSERRCISSSLRLFPEKSRNERRVKILAVSAEGEFKNFSDLNKGSGNKRKRR